MEMTSNKPAPKWRKVLVSGLLGAVVGLVAMTAFIALYEAGTLGELGTSSILACIAGAFYLLIGAQVAIGLALPGLGQRMLNVEDGEELHEQRGVLGYSAVTMALWGAALIVTALGGEGGILGPSAALVGALGLVAGCLIVTVFLWRGMDELMRNMSRECGNVSFYLLLLIGGIWAMLAQLGFAAAPAPIDWLTMFTVLPLLASFVIVARRGMLAPR